MSSSFRHPAKKRKSGAKGGSPGNAASKTGTASPAAAKRKPSLARRLLVWGAIALFWGVVAASAGLTAIALTLPPLDTLEAKPRKASARVIAADGGTIASYGEFQADVLAVGQMAPPLVQAVLAIEDRRFYDHWGVDPIGLARAMVSNVRAGGIVQGGSTITQQVAKNLFLTSDRTLLRKAQEVIVAGWLEQRLSKDEILALYLNRVYFGAGAYGVDAAAHKYFGRSAREVSVYEGAMIAGLLKAPSRLNPANSRARAEGRADVVLSAMVASGFLTDAEAQAAKAEGARYRGAAFESDDSRYFTDWVYRRARAYTDAEGTDLVIETTLDRRIQKIAVEEVEKLLAKAGDDFDVGQAAVVVMSPDGAVRAMVGGRDYGASQFNRAVLAKRQPGSVFKPLVYLAAIEQGLSPDDRVVDRPVSIDGWTPRNNSGQYNGEMSATESLTRSVNTVPAQLMETVGRRRVIDLARRMGIASPLPDAPSLALGVAETSPLEMTQAFAVIANSGKAADARGIERVRSKAGKSLYAPVQMRPPQIVSPADASRLTRMLERVVRDGTGARARLDRPAAGKTGTTQEARDAWFVGFTGDYVAGVWLGNDDGTPMNDVSGGGWAAILWQRIMRRVHEGKPVAALPIFDERPRLETVFQVDLEKLARDADGFFGWLDRTIRDLGGDGGAPPPARRDDEPSFGVDR
ncbi:MAG: PBP1A family penicillin-binding protein [Alphaproteobacteria bacterium]|nr:PBP1A family penicillin-binding protein [Alphaproteobacteria bacterium]